MSPTLLSIGGIAVVSLVSLVGLVFAGFSESFMKKMIFFLVSFAVGGLIGDVFIHILPELLEAGEEFFPTASFIIAMGILLSFALEKFIHWHHCHGTATPTHTHALGTMSIVGDVAHNFMDGILIASSFLIDTPTGIATTLAVVLHEIPQEISDYAILIYSGYSRKTALLLNFLTALGAVAGALLLFALQSSMPNIESYLFPLVAGNFLYIAVADLLPELHKQTSFRHSSMQFLGIGLGIGVMFLLTFLE